MVGGVRTEVGHPAARNGRDYKRADPPAQVPGLSVRGAAVGGHRADNKNLRGMGRELLPSGFQFVAGLLPTFLGGGVVTADVLSPA